jgi:hypothetical protein
VKEEEQKKAKDIYNAGARMKFSVVLVNSRKN